MNYISVSINGLKYYFEKQKSIWIGQTEKVGPEKIRGTWDPYMIKWDPPGEIRDPGPLMS